MDRWASDQLQPWLEIRANFPIGALLCVIHGATAGRHWEPSAARKQLRQTAALAGVRRRFAPHQPRHAHAIEMAHEGVPLVVIQRQLGHATRRSVSARALAGRLELDPGAFGERLFRDIASAALSEAARGARCAK
jgi:integrase/recombinase XerD